MKISAFHFLFENFKKYYLPHIFPDWKPEKPLYKVVQGKLVDSAGFAGLEMATDAVANATKMVHRATRSFQAVAKLAASSKLTT